MRASHPKLSRQLLKFILSIYFAITLVVTAAQMAAEYFHARSVILAELKDVENTFRAPLSTALWEINNEQLQAIQNGILGLPIVSEVVIAPPAGDVKDLAPGTSSYGKGISHRFRVSYNFAGEDNPLADVSFVTSESVVLGRVIHGFQMILISALIKSLVLVALFIWALRLHLGRPLEIFAREVKGVDLESLGRKRIDLGLKKKNELTDLEDAFNTMLKRLDDERRESTAALEAMNQSLEDKIADRTRELENSNAELQQFAYAASHDMREPLRMISSYVGLLERRLGKLLDQDCRDFIGFAADGAKRLDKMILALLEYSRIGRIADPKTSLPLAELLSEAVTNLSVALKDADAAIDAPNDLPQVFGHRNELVRLLQNLISNAVKYRDTSRPLLIRIGADATPSGWRISVADNGIGIPAEQSERIFGVFQRLHGFDIEGCGIGLANCKKIVEHHGGRIWVESGVDSGSVFYFTLPATQEGEVP